MSEKQRTKQSFRVNATLSEKHSAYLDKKSEEMGVTKSSLVSIAVNDWIQMEQTKDEWYEELIKEHLRELEEKAKEELNN